jgi:hypothetical protein
LPLAFLPPDFFSGARRDFSGVAEVKVSNELITLCLWPGVTGLSFLTAIF